MENQYDDFVKVIQDSTVCFHLFRFNINIVWIEPQSTIEDSHQFLLDNYAVHPNILYTHMRYC